MIKVVELKIIAKRNFILGYEMIRGTVYKRSAKRTCNFVFDYEMICGKIWMERLIRINVYTLQPPSSQELS